MRPDGRHHVPAGRRQGEVHQPEHASVGAVDAAQRWDGGGGGVPGVVGHRQRHGRREGNRVGFAAILCKNGLSIRASSFRYTSAISYLPKAPG